MTIFVLVLAVLFEGQIQIFHFGSDRPYEFPTREACEARLRIEEPKVPALLQEGAKLMAMRCLERPTKGAV